MADPRRALVEQMMQSQRGSPDLPGRGAVQELNQGGDQALMDFINQFGLARTQSGGAPPTGIPMPRPRLPANEPGPMGDVALQPPAAGLKTSDVMRDMTEGPAYETLAPVHGDVNAGWGPGPVGQEYEDRKTQMSDEDMLNHVQGQMGGFDWEGGDGAPTNNDIKYAMQDDDLKEEFIKHFGAPPEEFQGNENEPDNDPDDQGD